MIYLALSGKKFADLLISRFTLRYAFALRYVTLRYVTLRYVTLRYVIGSAQKFLAFNESCNQCCVNMSGDPQNRILDKYNQES